MTRYILIDSHTGYIWADSLDFGEQNETPESFARRVDETLDARHAAEHSYTVDETGQDGYLVYIAPKGFRRDYTGQDRDAIEAVDNECAYACFVAVEAIAGVSL